MLESIILLSALWISAAPVARADAYAPWIDCAGLAEGDECGSPGGYYYGHCKLNPNCTEDSSSGDSNSSDDTADMNTCLLCESDDEGKDDGCGGCSSLGRADAGVFGLQAIAGVAGLTILALRRRR